MELMVEPNSTFQKILHNPRIFFEKKHHLFRHAEEFSETTLAALQMQVGRESMCVSIFEREKLKVCNSFGGDYIYLSET